MNFGAERWTRALTSPLNAYIAAMAAQAAEPSVQTLVSALQALLQLQKLSLTRKASEQTSLLARELFRELITDVAIEEHRLAWRRRSRINAYVPYHSATEA